MDVHICHYLKSTATEYNKHTIIFKYTEGGPWSQNAEQTFG